MVSAFEPDFDFLHPDYLPVFERRVARLNRIRTGGLDLKKIKVYYRANIARFISDWGTIYEPRNVGGGLPTLIPFVLFPRQIEWVEWVLESWRERRPGVTAKSRESGVSWLAIAVSCSLCLLDDGLTIGFGSRKLDLVDKLGDPDALFWKARKFIALLPPEFRNGWTEDRDSSRGLINFPKTQCRIRGEGGDDIGRGGRASIYFVDEGGFLEHPDMAESSLSATTDCRIDISTPPYKPGGHFTRKVAEWPKERVFLFSWREDPRKDEAWYAKKLTELDPVTVAREINIDFAASATGILIPSAWVQAAIDAHIKLQFSPTGDKLGALDVADSGPDTNAFCAAHGVVLTHLEEWRGTGSDIFRTTERAFGLCDEHGLSGFRFDSDGLGAGVRGDARVINERRRAAGMPQLSVDTFRSSFAVVEPRKQDVPGRYNEDYFANAKAQACWSLRTRFQKTWRAVTGETPFADVRQDELISIPSKLPNLDKLCMELSRPTHTVNGAGKISIDKMPDGTRSPNLFDACMIRFARIKTGLYISEEAARTFARAAGQRG